MPIFLTTGYVGLSITLIQFFPLPASSSTSSSPSSTEKPAQAPSHHAPSVVHTQMHAMVHVVEVGGWAADSGAWVGGFR